MFDESIYMILIDTWQLIRGLDSVWRRWWVCFCSFGGLSLFVFLCSLWEEQSCDGGDVVKPWSSGEHSLYSGLDCLAGSRVSKQCGDLWDAVEGRSQTQPTQHVRHHATFYCSSERATCCTALPPQTRYMKNIICLSQASKCSLKTNTGNLLWIHIRSWGRQSKS